MEEHKDETSAHGHKEETENAESHKKKEEHKEPVEHKETHHQAETGHKETPPHKADFEINNTVLILIGIVAVLLIFNQFQISGMGTSGYSINVAASDVYDIKTTSQAIALLFPVNEIKSDQDAIDMMISQGTPSYGDAYGITFDDPVGGMEILAKAYPGLKADIKENNPEVWERYLNLATKPVGISCEFCCGVGPKGINNKGDLTCGCKHNPAIQALTMLLMKDTNMNDAEVLREAMRWKSVWFPRDMVGLALKASGGEIETELPGMVGGC